MGFTFVAAAGNQSTASGASGDTSTTLNIQAGDVLIGMYGWRAATDVSNLLMAQTDGSTNAMSLLAQVHSASHSGVIGYKIAASAASGVTFRVSHTESVAYRTWIVYQFRPDAGETVTLDATATPGQANSTAPLSGAINTTGADCVAVGFVSKYALRTTSSQMIAGAVPGGTTLYDYASACYSIFTETQSSITAAATLATSTLWIEQFAAFKSEGGGGLPIAAIAMHNRRGD